MAWESREGQFKFLGPYKGNMEEAAGSGFLSHGSQLQISTNLAIGTFWIVKEKEEDLFPHLFSVKFSFW